MTRLLYYSQTTLKGLQTLGEEYCDILLTTNASIPSRSKRLAFLFFHIVAPFVSYRFLHSSLTTTTSKWLYDVVYKQCMSLNLAMFYLFGVYYSLSNRITGLNYVSLTHSGNSKSGYELLGILVLLQLLLQPVRTPQNKTLETETRKTGTNCSLCLSPRTATTSTQCGHLFCWHCIAGWCVTKQECPLCRQPIQHNTLYPLYHYQ